MISRNSKRLSMFLLTALFVIGEIDASAQSKSAQTAEFNAPATTPAISSGGPGLAPSNTSIKIGGVTFSGSLRMRFESWDWFETGSATGSYNFGGATLRLSIGQQKENFEWQIDGVFPLLI